MSSASTPASILDVSVLRDLQEAIGGDRAVAEELVHVFLTDAAELVNATGALAAQEPFDREAFRRTVVEELVTQLHADSIFSEDLDKKMRMTDKRLRRYVVDHDFLWDDALRDVYPKDRFWWLWSLPQT